MPTTTSRKPSHQGIVQYEQFAAREIAQLITIFVSAGISKEFTNLYGPSEAWLAAYDRITPAPKAHEAAYRHETSRRTDATVMCSDAWVPQHVSNMAKSIDENENLVDRKVIDMQPVMTSSSVTSSILAVVPAKQGKGWLSFFQTAIFSAAAPPVVAFGSNSAEVKRLDLETGQSNAQVTVVPKHELATNGPHVFESRRVKPKMAYSKHMETIAELVTMLLMLAVVYQSVVEFLAIVIQSRQPVQLGDPSHSIFTNVSHAIKHVGAVCLLFVIFRSKRDRVDHQRQLSLLRIALLVSVASFFSAILLLLVSASTFQDLVFDAFDNWVLLSTSLFILRPLVPTG